MKTIYLVLTYTGTIPAKLIKLYTKHKYSHISVSLDEQLTEMYSFARINPYNAFIGGFIKEEIDKGTFKRFPKTVAKIYEMKVTEEQYENMQNIIQNMYKEKKKYKYNYKGLLFLPMNKKYEYKNKFYCSEFVKYLLKEINVNIEILPELARPENFEELEGLRLIYEGSLKQYKNHINSN